MILRRLYSLWVLLSMFFCFLLLILPLLILVSFKSLHKSALRINYIWSWCFVKIACIPIKEEWRFQLDKKQQYILCANHFSYMDIPILGLFPMAFKFVGKNSLTKIPLFGYMYRSLHITVNRSSYRSRAQSLLKAREAIQNNFNLGFFPEGGIRLDQYPKMAPFKDGAFKLAVENNVPIVPVTMADNYFVLNDDDLMNMRRKTCRIIYHEPIWAEGQGEEDVKRLREEVFLVIQTELNKSYNQ